VTLIVDREHEGPSVESWNRRVSRENISSLAPLHARRLVVVAPHPDDEVLGAGGLVQQALRDGLLVEVVAVTDGEASHPNFYAICGTDLARIRRGESEEALRRLGWEEPTVTRLGLPDGDVKGNRRQLDQALESILLPDDLCVAPWRRDGHPDHDECGDAARRASAAVGARSVSCLIWAWHWADPEGGDIPWDRCVRLDLGRRARARKRWATQAFESQIRPIGPAASDQAILPPAILRRFWRGYEIFIEDSTD
jgi:LmbE family N-acetylglucosaminyl deacetylase